MNYKTRLIVLIETFMKWIHTFYSQINLPFSFLGFFAWREVSSSDCNGSFRIFTDSLQCFFGGNFPSGSLQGEGYERISKEKGTIQNGNPLVLPAWAGPQRQTQGICTWYCEIRAKSWQWSKTCKKHQTVSEIWVLEKWVEDEEIFVW